MNGAALSYHRVKLNQYLENKYTGFKLNQWFDFAILDKAGDW
jgi:hypothetical protein